MSIALILGIILIVVGFLGLLNVIGIGLIFSIILCVVGLLLVALRASHRVNW